MSFSSYQLALLPRVAFSVFGKLPHFLVPLVLRLFSLANQGQLLLQPLFAFGLVFFCTQLYIKKVVFFLNVLIIFKRMSVGLH